MKKIEKKNIFVRIFACLLTFCMGFCFVGCMGFGLDDIDEEEIENMTDEEFEKWLNDSMPVSMYGTKVLYRPQNYDFDKNSRPPESMDTVNDYYAQYAWQSIRYLHNLYNVYNSEFYSGGRYAVDEELTSPSQELLPYLYDASRYTITETKQYILAGGEEASYEVVANTSYKWNWSFGVTASLNNGEEDPSFNSFLTIQNGDLISGEIKRLSFVNNYYQRDTFITNYETAYLGGARETDYDNYSEFAQALTYAIYRYSLDLEPEEVRVTQTDNGLVNLTIGGKNVDTALEEVKELHAKYARYVGVNDTLVTKIRHWVLKNVIGDSALNAPKTITEYVYTQKTIEKEVDGETQKVPQYIQADGTEGDTETEEPVWNAPTSSQITIERNYEQTLEMILDKVNSLVSIGGFDDGDEGESSIGVSKPYLASQMTEYLGGMFMVSGDKNFPRAGSKDANKVTAIPAQEYQSVSFMFKEKTRVDSLWVALKYDVDSDGTGETDEVDPNETRYLELSLSLNYYNHKTQTMTTINSPKLKVYHGSYDLDFITFSGEENFSGGTAQCPDDHSSGYVFDGLELEVDAFNPDIGNNVLKTDVGFGNYKSRPLKSKYPLLISGHSRAKNWFEIVYPEENENAFYTGRLNSNMFNGADGCDYLEICYKVYKDETLGSNKNYKFYTGITAFMDL